MTTIKRLSLCYSLAVATLSCATLTGCGAKQPSESEVNTAINQKRCVWYLDLGPSGGCYSHTGKVYGVDSLKLESGDPKRCQEAQKDAREAAQQYCNTPEGLTGGEVTQKIQ